MYSFIKLLVIELRKTYWSKYWGYGKVKYTGLLSCPNGTYSGED
jgi:hypothetical protein